MGWGLFDVFGFLKAAQEMALQKAVDIGRQGNVVFLDCGNGFDPYFVLRLSKDRLEAKKILNRVFVSRPFTFYQLKQLVENDLQKAAKDHSTNQVILFALTALFTDESRDEAEKIGVLNSIIGKIIQLEGQQPRPEG